MLPNHAPLMVAERFKVLEALFPGRIDLGLGRAPGTDPVTSYALRRRQDVRTTTISCERFQELLLFESNAFPEGHPFRNVHAMPQDVRAAADLAARLERLQRAARRHGRRRLLLRAPFLRPRRRRGPMLSYREQFKPSAARDTPYAILGLAAVCADSDAEAERLAATIDLNWVRRARGEYLPLASPEEAQAYPYSPVDRERIRAQPRARCSSARQATVLARLTPLIEATKADEVMVTTMIYDHAARRHSYELLAQAFGLS